MSPRPPVHPDLAVALRALHARGMSTAELCRVLGDVAERLGHTRPSYSTVRRLLIDDRVQAELVDSVVLDALADVLTGRMRPHRYSARWHRVREG